MQNRVFIGTGSGNDLNKSNFGQIVADFCSKSTQAFMKDGCTSQKVKKQRAKLPILKNSNTQENPEKDGIRASRSARWRAFALITLNVLMTLHVIQWWIMGKTVSPIEPSESMFTLQNGAINAGFIFFTLAILATLIFGRFVCGWGCHVLALQDLCGWLLKKIGLKPKPFRSRLLIFIPLVVAFYMFIYPSLVRFFTKPANEPMISQWTNHIVTTEFWATFPTVAVAIPFLFICGFMTVYFLGQKGFCTYACPYGGFFSLADKVAPGKIRVTDACEGCGHCTAVCTSNVLVHKEVAEYGMVVDQGCMKCMDCVSVCPNDALYFGFGKPAVGVKQTIKKNYSLTWTEEIVGVLTFAASYFAVWNVYQLVPMLMALGIAIVSTYLALRTLKLLTSKDLSFYRYNLKSSGTMNKSGWIFLTLSLIWLGVNAHSGFIRYHERAAAKSYESVQLPDELALAQANPEEWLSPADRENIAEGKKHFYTASAYGLFVNKESLSKLAWMEFLTGNTEQALNMLGKAAEYQTGEGKALSLYYRGAILSRSGKYDEALKNLEQSIKERPDLVLALEEKGEALWKLGRRQEAVAVWIEALKKNPRLPLTSSFLAGATASVGQAETSLQYEKLAEKLTPPDALFEYMLGLRLQNIGMTELANKHFDRAERLNPSLNPQRK